MIKKCKICGTDFETEKNNKLICSDDCKKYAKKITIDKNIFKRREKIAGECAICQYNKTVKKYVFRNMIILLCPNHYAELRAGLFNAYNIINR